jgi:hypothetical protein
MAGYSNEFAGVSRLSVERPATEEPQLCPVGVVVGC